MGTVPQVSQNHKNRNGENKTRKPRVSVVTTQENRTKPQKPSFLLFCFSLSKYCTCLHASHDSGRSIPLLSGCQEQLFPAKQTLLRSHFPEVWIQPLPRSGIRPWHRQLYPSHRHSWFGITLCVPSQLAQPSSCPSYQIYSTSKTQ